MDRTYEKFLRRNMDLSCMGLERRKDAEPYFCTPRGASIFGWEGVDGIHFCFIRGFGGMVFSVSPMNGFPDYVRPLAKDFADFLRLLLACGHTAAPEQAWMWEKEQFADFLRDNPPTEEQRKAMEKISERMQLAPMEEPWSYIKELQSTFDYSRIRYTEACFDADMNPAAERTAPPWKVYFGGGFWKHHGRDRAGREIPLDSRFAWAGGKWRVPASYVCGKGMVVDICAEVDGEGSRNFFDSHLTVNGKCLSASEGCAVVFDPGPPEGTCGQPEAEWAVEHYGLEPSCGWMIYRVSFPWQGKRPSAIKTLSLTMEPQWEWMPAESFQVHGAGDTVAFSHPVNGTPYTLTVEKIERQTISADSFGSDGWEYPTHYVTMSYTISPKPEEAVMIQDQAEGDRPRRLAPKENPFGPDAVNDCTVGIIGGGDGPVAILCGAGPRGGDGTACSALHFTPVRGDVRWCAAFRVKRFEQLSVSLI